MRDEIYEMIEHDDDPCDYEYVTYLSQKYGCSEYSVRGEIYSVIQNPRRVNPLVSWLKS